MNTPIWYVIDDPPASGHKLYIPAEIVSVDDWLVTVKCLTRPWMPRLDMSVAEDRHRIRPRGHLQSKIEHLR